MIAKAHGKTWALVIWNTGIPVPFCEWLLSHVNFLHIPVGAAGY